MAGCRATRTIRQAFQRSITSDPNNKTAMRNDSLCWDDITRLRDIWPGTLMIKGVMRTDDAVTAAPKWAPTR